MNDIKNYSNGHGGRIKLKTDKSFRVLHISIKEFICHLGGRDLLKSNIAEYCKNKEKFYRIGGDHCGLAGLPQIMSTYAILGGCGFVGRNLVEKLIKDPNCAKIIVCDKRRYEMSSLTPNQEKCFKDPRVVYKQISLTNEHAVNEFFEKNPADYMINSAAETRLSLSYEIYEENIYKLGMVVARQAAKMKCKKFIQITSARLKILPAVDSRENSMTGLLKAQKKLEDDLASIEGPARIYGIGDTTSIVPLLLLMGMYKHNGEDLKILWTEDIKTRTVHVDDVVAACLFLAKIDGSGLTYEICDKSNSTHGSVTKTSASVFNAKYHFMGKLENMMAASVVADINEKHLKLWADVCSKEKIDYSPLIPVFTEEQLMLVDFDVDVAPLESIGFTLSRPNFEASALKDILVQYADQGIYPKSYLP